MIDYQFELTTPQLVVMAVLTSLGWVGIGIVIGHWIWGG